ncbi:efflux RND transporter permease subunit [bacterium]|nr:efflux RND transporter permease subunit [bacterium]
MSKRSDLTSQSVRYPSLTLIAVLLVLAWGLFYYFTMSRREDPDITILGAQLTTIWPGALSEDVEQYVTDPLEQLCEELPEVQEMTSFSRSGISQIWVELDKDTPKDDVPQIWDRLRAKIQRLAATLPQGCFLPVVDDEFFDTASHIFCISGSAYSPRELEAAAERMKERFSELPAAGRVSVIAAQPERIYLDFDPARLTQFGLHPRQVLDLVRAQNALLPGGSIDAGGDTYAITASGEFTSLESMRGMQLLASESGQSLRLGDLGRVRYGYLDPPELLCRVDGKPAVAVSIVMRQGKNVIDLGRQVDGALEEMRRELPEDLQITRVQDQPEQVEGRVHIFIENLRDGVILVSLLVLLFMGWRAAIPVVAAIPLTLVGTFALLSMLGTDLHQLSIAALIISLGLVVDDAVVVNDNVYRYLEMGYPPIRAAIEGTRDILVPDLTGTLTTMVAFMPLLGLRGDAGQFVRDIPIVVCCALAMSFLVSITVTPLLGALLLKPRSKPPREALMLPLLAAMQRAYLPLLAFSQRFRALSLLAMLALFVSSVLLFPRVGMQFFPGAERNQFVVEIEAPTGTAIGESLELAAYAERYIAQQEGVRNFVTWVGGSGPRFYYALLSESNLPSFARIVVNTESVADAARLASLLQRELPAEVPGARVRSKLLEQGPPIGDPIQIEIEGEKLQELTRLGEELKALLAQVPGVVDIHDNFGRPSQQIRLQVDEAALRQTGLTSADIAGATATSFSGEVVSMFRAPGREIPIVARLEPRFLSSAASLERVFLHSPVSGRPVALSSLVRIESAQSISQIQRSNARRQYMVLAGTDVGVLPSSAMQQIRPLAEALELPPGYSLRFKGEAEESGEAFSGLGQATIVVLLLIMLILVAQFKSVRIALVIFLTIPLSLIGAFLGLYLTGWPFGFIAGLGLTSLAGIVVNNGILMIDFVVLRLREGLPLAEAIRDSGTERLRPILLTSLACVFGLLPLGLSGGSMWAPLSFTVIGGVLVCTVLTLIFVPLVFSLIGARRAVSLAALEAQQEEDMHSLAATESRE